jgi:hypothetical protein
VNVGAAHTRAPDADENFIFADYRLCNVAQLEAGSRCWFYKCFQFESPE